MATSYTLTMNPAVLDQVALTEAVRLVTATTLRVLNRATVLTPVDTGRLRASNQWRVLQAPNQVVGEVWNDTEYAAAVHDGTRSYVVRPVRRKALRFEVDGKVVFAKRVTIPARPGRPWLKRALEEIAGSEGYIVQV